MPPHTIMNIQQNGNANNTQQILEPQPQREIEEIIAILSRPLPRELIKQKPVGKGNSRRQVDFLPWHQVVQILNKYAPGWNWEIRTIHTTAEDLFLVGRLTIPTPRGNVWREATGTEKLECSDYGDASSNAESMALRRAAAKFGLALHLYTNKLG